MASVDHTTQSPNDVIFRLPPESYEMLKALAERTGKTIPELLAQAITLEQMYLDAQRDRKKVLLERDGKYEEVWSERSHGFRLVLASRWFGHG